MHYPKALVNSIYPLKSHPFNAPNIIHPIHPHSPIHPSVRPLVRPSVHPSIHPSTIHSSTNHSSTTHPSTTHLIHLQLIHLQPIYLQPISFILPPTHSSHPSTHPFPNPSIPPCLSHRPRDPPYVSFDASVAAAESFHCCCSWWWRCPSSG